MRKIVNCKKKLLSLGLAFLMLAGVLVPVNVQAEENTEFQRTDAKGVETLKTVIYDETKKEYKLRLESYVIGAKTDVSEEKNVPTDFVMAIDVSGSMHRPLDCGCSSLNDNRVHNKSNHPVYAEKIETDGQYYRDTNRSPLYYCSTCECWHDTENVENHEEAVHYIPKTAEDDSDETHAQFYLSCKSRLEAAKEALDDFLGEIKKRSKGKDGVQGTADDVQHRVAIIAFGGPNYDKYDDDNEHTDELSNVTGLYTYGGDDHKVIYYNLAKNHYADALRDVTVEAEWNILEGVSEKLAIQEGTRTDYAAKMIKNVLESYNDEGRNRVAILFTDGVPRSQQKDYKCANDALSAAKAFKTGTNPTPFYVVGCFEEADASTIAPLNGGNDPNKFMNLLSSNYLDAVESDKEYSMEDVNPELVTTDADNNKIIDSKAGSYYQIVKNTAEMMNAFKTIVETSVQGGAEYAELDSKTVVQDTISKDYVVDEANGRTIVAYVQSYTGKDSEGKDTWGEADYSLNLQPVVSGQVVEVSGFDFSANYVGFDTDLQGVSTARGKKLVLEIPIDLAADNYGGNEQATNDPSSAAVYYPDAEGKLEVIEHFALPHVDVPTTVTVKKIVDEKEPDKELQFNFNAEGDDVIFDSYLGNDQSDGNYLEAVGKDLTSEFKLAHEGEIVIEDVLVGSELTIKEENLPKHYGLISVVVNGKECQPDADGNYTFTVEADTEVVFTNKIVSLDIEGKKTWDDRNDKDGIRPDEITIHLLADGVKVKNIKVTAKNGWKWTFENLPKYNEKGEEIVYTITEDAVTGYTAVIEGYHVTNKHTPKGHKPQDPDVPGTPDTPTVFSILSSPKTGDNANAALYIVVLAVAAIAGFAVYKKNKR